MMLRRGGAFMIFVDRTTVTVPDSWLKTARAAHDKAAGFFSRSPEERRQERFKFDLRPIQTVKPYLERLFRGKCAYCESPVTTVAFGEVDRFRPRTEAVGAVERTSKRKARSRVRSDPDAYWWLAYEWSNLYLTCGVCARNKRNQFPVIGPRAQAPARGPALQSELAVLIDPCVDRPELYFGFSKSGQIVSLSLDRHAIERRDGGRYGSVDRARATIDVIGLNRPALVEARRKEYERLRDEFQLHLHARKGAKPSIAELADPGRPYAGMRQQFLMEWAGPQEPAKAAKRTIAGRRQSRKPARPRSKTIVAGEIESIHIKDFRAVQDLTLRFPTGTRERAGWIMLLGENGAGKSSILQATALALMGEAYVRDYMRTFKLRPAYFLRRVRGEETVDSSSVKIQFRTGEALEFSITRKKIAFSRRPPAKLFVRGYGPTRLLPRRNLRRPPVGKPVVRSVTNLFDPSRPVMNANDWLKRLRGPRFDSAALSLKDLLNIPLFKQLEIGLGKVWVPMHGLLHPIDDLSAGYESVLSMAADIMAGALGSVHDLSHASGIVLLDEIDAHLHPRWKMRIVESLRATFSSMQFIVTTHEPLCLRGIKEQEVVVLRREGDEVLYIDNLPSPSDLRVDQLLTSELFGLHTALDPKIDAAFDEYYRLPAKKDRLTKGEQAKLARLRKKLPPIRMVQMLGDTKREQLVYEAVDQFLANTLVQKGQSQADTLRADLDQMRDDVKQRIANIWQGAE